MKNETELADAAQAQSGRAQGHEASEAILATGERLRARVEELLTAFAGTAAR